MELFKKEYKFCFLLDGAWGANRTKTILSRAKTILDKTIDQWGYEFAYIRLHDAVYIPLRFKHLWFPSMKLQIIKLEGDVRFVFY